LIVQIPTDSDVPQYTQITSLDGVAYQLSFAWNTRDGHWYLTIADVDGNTITAGLRIVCNKNLLRRCLDSRAPQGALFADDTTGEGRDPDFVELGTRVQLVYISKSELP
jgi:hypothetical protein